MGGGLGFRVLGCRWDAVDDIDPALPIIGNLPEFPWFRVLKVMQDSYHQQYHLVKPPAPCIWMGLEGLPSRARL